MDQEYSNENRGVAFKNDHKETERHPDWKGKGNFNGQDFEFGIWKKTSKGGQDFMSFSFSPPYVKEPKEDIQIDDISDEPVDLSEIPF